MQLVDILDREVVGSYNCTLTASNALGSSAPLLLIIAVMDSNDNTPAFTSNLYLVEVRENARVGRSVAKVTARDADTGVITYSILSGL